MQTESENKDEGVIVFDLQKIADALCKMLQPIEDIIAALEESLSALCNALRDFWHRFFRREKTHYSSIQLLQFYLITRISFVLQCYLQYAYKLLILFIIPRQNQGDSLLVNNETNVTYYVRFHNL